MHRLMRRPAPSSPAPSSPVLGPPVLRRLALGLALPLALGAPVLLAGPAQAATTPTVDVGGSQQFAVYGQEIRVDAHVFSGEVDNNVSAGSIQFSVAGVEIGAPVHLDPSGHAVSVPLFDEDGGPLHRTIASDFYLVTADFLPDNPADYDATSSSFDQHINEAATTIAVLAGPTSIVADVTGQFPGGVQQGSRTATGPVDFTLNGAPIGTADLVNGKATLNVVLPNGAPRTVTATYAGDGDDNYLGSQQTLTRTDPTITALVLSRLPKSSSGWYHTSVNVWFKCDPAGSELIVDCPKNVRLRANGKNQSLTRMILAKDGGSAAVTVTGVNIDRVPPVITIVGDRCTASDKLSGLKGRCHLHLGPSGHYRAVAVDNAGNRAVQRGVLD